MRKQQGQPLPLGVTMTENSVNFSVVVSVEKSCKLIVREKGAENPVISFDMSREDGVGEVRFLTLNHFDFDKYEYEYQIDDEAEIDSYVKELTGIYEWEGDRPLRIPFNEIVAYSLHVKGFTAHESSSVLKKGTFDGLIEKLPYLSNLGVNQIHLMPVYELKDKDDTDNYWGYGPGYYFLPKSSFAGERSASVALKDFVKAAHKQGIEVVLDIYFTSDTKKYLMHDCLRQYVIDYHIDGFILDYQLIPMEDIYDDPILKGTKFFQRQNYFQKDMRKFLKGDSDMVSSLLFWQRFSGDKSIFNYITSHNGFTLEDLVSYQEKHNEMNGEGKQDGPNDNESWNCGVEGATDKTDIINLREKQKRNAMTLLLLAQGIPCILAGDEFGNTQYGNNNAYCQDNEISWLDWNDIRKNQMFYEFVKELIAFRNVHPVFSQEEELFGKDMDGYGLPDISYHGEYLWQPSLDAQSRQIGICYAGSHCKDSDFYVAYNMHWEERKFALPKLPQGKEWYLYMTTEKGFLEEPKKLDYQKKANVPARTIAIYVGKRI